jgi:hypothetical protein
MHLRIYSRSSAAVVKWQRLRHPGKSVIETSNTRTLVRGSECCARSALFSLGLWNLEVGTHCTVLRKRVPSPSNLGTHISLDGGPLTVQARDTLPVSGRSACPVPAEPTNVWREQKAMLRGILVVSCISVATPWRFTTARPMLNSPYLRIKL